MANIGYGTLLQHSPSTDGVTFTTIAELTEIGEFGAGEADDVDVTSHDSVDGHREFIRGLIDAGEISFTGVWEEAASQQTVVTQLQTGPTSALDYFKITLPNNLGVFDARGFFTSMTINPQLDDRVEFSGAVKLSGKPTFTF